ncbi:MAG: hypothetical protein EA409_08830 [Saprospirales bacterium]|nr:MAG: hypothetical protein EA409_08830 [Saprospirales bacterium]
MQIEDNNIHYFWNPFDRIAGITAIAWGVIFLVFGSFTAWLGTARYPGLISMQYVESVHWLDGFLDQLVSLAIAVIVFAVAAFIAGARRFRIVDLVGTFMVAKAPLLILPIFNFNGWMYKKSMELTEVALEGEALPDLWDTIILILLSILLIFFLIWTIVLLFHAYRVSTNLKGLPSFVSFILAMVVTLIASYIFIPAQYF